MYVNESSIGIDCMKNVVFSAHIVDALATNVIGAIEYPRIIEVFLTILASFYHPINLDLYLVHVIVCDEVHMLCFSKQYIAALDSVNEIF